MGGLFSDPDLMNAFSDPEIGAALKDISTNPANIMKYQNNPKVMAMINKMAGAWFRFTRCNDCIQSFTINLLNCFPPQAPWVA